MLRIAINASTHDVEVFIGFFVIEQVKAAVIGVGLRGDGVGAGELDLIDQALGGEFVEFTCHTGKINSQ
ncbi:hypothetical protein AC790_01010 [Pantoea sp. RIT-PI-b]|nr:hypothetical protein AC790_01010 [Pantoea sp. RIT-PI-b]